jgi:3alpha(or 20beta)-hydroxysteroid dehydrogenase
MDRLAGKVALITGAANGMGSSHARLFAREGARVVVTDVDVQRGKELADELGPDAVFIELDVTEKSSWAIAVSEGSRLFGPITVLVNNAGVAGTNVSTGDITDDEYRKTIDVDLHGTFNGIRAVLPQMAKAGGGSIVNISSTAGIIATVDVNVAYVIAKFGVRGMTKQVAAEYAQQNIRVNSVHPGPIWTPLVDDLLKDVGDEFKERFFRTIPVQRFGQAEEVSNAVLFLASDESSYMTGSEVVVDGGQVIW